MLISNTAETVLCHQTDVSHFYSVPNVLVCVCVHVFVCVRHKQGERERERKKSSVDGGVLAQGCGCKYNMRESICVFCACKQQAHTRVICVCVY